MNLFVKLFLFFIAMPVLAQETLSVKQLDELQKKLLNEAKFEEALPYAEKLVALAQKEGVNDTLYVVYLIDLSSILDELGNTEKSEALLLEAIGILKKQPNENERQYAVAASNLAGIYKRSARFEEAEFYYMRAKALMLQQANKDNLSIAILLNNIGLFYKTQNRFEEAEINIRLAKSVFEKVKDDTKNKYPYIAILNNLATVCGVLEYKEEALSLYDTLLPLVKSFLGEKHPSFAAIINNKAKLCMAMKRNTEAETLLLKANEILKSTYGANHIFYIKNLIILASFYYSKGDLKTAKQYNLETLSLTKKMLGSKHPNYSEALNALAVVYKDEGDQATSVQLLLEAISANAIESDSIATLDSEWLSSLQDYAFLDEGILVKSLMLLQEVLSKQKKLLDNPESLDLLLKIGDVTCQIQTNRQSRASSQKDRFLLLEATYLSTIPSIRILSELYENSGNEAIYKDKAFLLSERNKAAIILGAVQAQKAVSFGDLPDTLLSKESYFALTYDQLSKRLLEAKNDEQKTQIRSSLNLLHEEKEAFKKMLIEKYPKYHRAKYAEISISVEEIATLLAPKAMLIEYLQSDSFIYVFAITNKKSNFIKLPINKKNLHEQVKLMRKALGDYEYITHKPEEAKQLYIQTAYWFYKSLLEPILKDEQELNALIVVPDGELGHLPFEAFLMETPAAKDNYPDFHYLLNDFKVSYNYAATLWKDNIGQVQKESSKPMLALAASYNNLNDSGAVYKNRPSNLRNLRESLSDLPAVKQEVEGLSKLFVGDFFYGTDANENTFKRKASDYGIIHLAMHGLLNTQHPILSSLVFTEDEDSLEDNFLQAYEISSLQLNAQLVVLSACETGYGKFQQGEGVMSLARSFMYAGVPSLVVSMWQVNDQSTSLIMQAFYKNLAKGMDKAEALRQAKLEYIRSVDAIAAHPAFWAAFVQLGDSRPIHIHIRQQGWGWWIGGGLLAVAAVGAGAVAMRRKKK